MYFRTLKLRFEQFLVNFKMKIPSLKQLFSNLLNKLLYKQNCFKEGISFWKLTKKCSKRNFNVQQYIYSKTYFNSLENFSELQNIDFSICQTCQDTFQKIFFLTKKSCLDTVCSIVLEADRIFISFVKEENRHSREQKEEAFDLT